MKRLQRLIPWLIIISPIIIGIILMTSHASDRASSISRVGFRKLGRVTISGAIVESETAVKELKELLGDNSVAGVILRIDSPGGATAPSQEIYHAVKEYRASGKPLIVSMGNVAASGGYYIASGAKKIFALPGTLTGSIGVIMTVPLYRELSKKIGIEVQTYKAGTFKDIASPYRKMSATEQQMLQGLLDDTHRQFISDVASVRSMEPDSLAAIADGRIFTGRQAVACGLVDTLGGYEEALAYLRNITGLGPGSRVVSKHETTRNLREWFLSESVKLFPQAYRFLSSAGLHCLMVLE